LLAIHVDIKFANERAVKVNVPWCAATRNRYIETLNFDHLVSKGHIESLNVDHLVSKGHIETLNVDHLVSKGHIDLTCKK
jgi:hypothetical protein